MMFRSHRPAPLGLAVQAASLAALAGMLLLEWRAHPASAPASAPAALCMASSATVHAGRGAAPAGGPCVCAQPALPHRAGTAPAVPACSPSGTPS
ncbi:hypothetical protein ASC94_13110 [Massilia sp. Root418]|uniref:hypothetical protein n=1 Tax=Massilia sp. Root418 TaxID=1736532 RepID=UPI0007125615|nr:hypothetical protein [Massilia sp. Root418]KQW93554.1 hypothetical protein ASC94_13110 [Massilia sp. Root418]